MKQSEGKTLIDSCIKRGWVRKGNRIYTPAEALSFNIQPDKSKRKNNAKRTGWIDDELNIRNKAKHTDMFITLVKIEIGLDVWPEFYFTVERNWRFDYCIPEFKIAIEQEGGIHTGGRHTRGKGFEGDMEKYNAAASMGWTLIRRSPKQLCTSETIELIKKAMICKNVI